MFGNTVDLYTIRLEKIQNKKIKKTVPCEILRLIDFTFI